MWSEPSIPAKEFTLFMLLPIELRRRIWRHAASALRITRMAHIIRMVGIIGMKLPYMVTLQVNHEARKETLLHFNHHINLRSLGIFMLDLKRDIVYITVRDFMNILPRTQFCSLVSARHIAFDVRYRWDLGRSDGILENHYCNMFERLLSYKNLETITFILGRLKPVNIDPVPMVHEIFGINSGLKLPLTRWPKVLLTKLPCTYSLVQKSFLDAIDHQTEGPGTPHTARDFLSLVQQRLDQIAPSNPKWK